MRTVILHEGGLGDLILAETFLAALREQRPDERLELLCRADVAPAAGLFERPPDAVRTFAFNPYLWDAPSESVAHSIREYLASLGDEPVRTFFSASLRATPLSEVLAAALHPSEAPVFGDPGARTQSLAQVLLAMLGLVPNDRIVRLAHHPGEHELGRYRRLADSTVVRLPVLRRLAPDAKEAPVITVFPVATVAINRWPVERLAAAATAIAVPRGASILLIAAARDRDELEHIAEHDGFSQRPEILAGSPHDLADVAGRIAGSLGFIGLDTGLAHLATAYGVPGATVYGGGGHWPAYAPWRATTAAVLAPIPCYGCNWACAFDFAYCLAGVDVASAVAAFERSASGSSGDSPHIEVDPYTARERDIFERAARVHHAGESDRAARLRVITRLDATLHRHATRLTDAVSGGPSR